MRDQVANETKLDLPDVLQFMRELWAVVHALERASKRMASEIGVTGPQRLVVRVVGLFPGVSAGELADILHVHPSTLTGVLQRLTRHRLLARVADPRDRRRAILRLTPSGQRANGSSQGTVEGSVARVLQSLPPADRAATRRVLVALAGSLAPATPPPIRSSGSSSRTSASRGSAGAVRASKGRRTRR